jgi:hypothetical protein
MPADSTACLFFKTWTQAALTEWLTNAFKPLSPALRCVAYCVTACIDDVMRAYTPPTSRAIGIMMMMIASGSSLLVSLSTL